PATRLLFDPFLDAPLLAQHFLHRKEWRPGKIVGTIVITNETAFFIEPYRVAEKWSGAEIQALESAPSGVLFNPRHQFAPDSAASRLWVNSHPPNVERIAFRRSRHGSDHHIILRRHPDRAFIQAAKNLVHRRDRGRKRFGRIKRLEFQKRLVKR